MPNEPRNIVYTATDLDAAKKLFTTLLGTEPYVDTPYYVGYKPGGVEVGLTRPDQSQGPGGTLFFDVADIEAALKELEAAGAETVQKPRNVGGGMLVASVRDADGNVLGLSQSGGQAG